MPNGLDPNQGRSSICPDLGTIKQTTKIAACMERAKDAGCDQEQSPFTEKIYSGSL